ncbi:MAG: peptide chain release factor N(5)-glutamine methyltransferase, partial [Candidatus Omnitrophica bacterium]|nr:peptide chain release factor N(5)-glutamine methyltransferase [Candidatus Omnitrophota bacterium]
ATTCKIMASDVSQEALAVARENAELNNCLGKIEFVKSDLFANLPSGRRFDIIVSNPPYVAGHEFAWLQKEIGFEPKLALDGGRDGLAFYRSIIKEAPAFLKKNGFLAFEIGFSQAVAVKAMLKAGLFDKIGLIKDYNHITRIVTAQYPWTN